MLCPFTITIEVRTRYEYQGMETIGILGTGNCIERGDTIEDDRNGIELSIVIFHPFIHSRATPRLNRRATPKRLSYPSFGGRLQ